MKKIIERIRARYNRFRGRPFWYVPYWTHTRVEYFGFDDVASSVGPGWRDILAKLTEKLFLLGWNGGLLQVKEKFGGLRFYYQNNIGDPVVSEIANDVVEIAEYRTTQACDQCGKYGKTRGTGWLVTLCDEHYKKYEEERSERFHTVS
jgi:hypothetical protein